MKTLDDAIELIRAGKRDDAQKLLEPLLEADPHNMPAWFWYLETWSSNQQRIMVLELCLQHNPTNERAKQALVMLQAQHLADAQKAPTSILPTKPKEDSLLPANQPQISLPEPLPISRTPSKPKQLSCIGSLATVIIVGMLGVVVCGIAIAIPGFMSSPSAPANSIAPSAIPTIGPREFDYGETVVLCGNYRVERGDKWETIIAVCDLTNWERVSVTPDSTYPGKALITYTVENKRLLFAWSGDALILWEAWEYS